jgi:hypothetical protein
MAYVPTNPNAVAVQADLLARLQAAGLTLSGKDTQLALIDNMLCASGYQGSDSQAMSGGGAFNITAGSWNPYGPTWAFTAPIAMTYVVDLQVNAFLNQVAAASCYFGLRLVNSNGTTDYQGTSLPAFVQTANSQHARWTGKFAVPMVAGANTLQVLALGDVGSTWQFTTVTSRTFFVTGG